MTRKERDARKIGIESDINYMIDNNSGYKTSAEILQLELLYLILEELKEINKSG